MNKYHEYARAQMLPPIPTTIKPLRQNADEQDLRQAVVVGGLNLIGEQGYICPTVSIICCDELSGQIFGWSLCLGNPDSVQNDEPYHFRTSTENGVGTAKGTEFPNTMMYFQAEVPAELASSEADRNKLEEVIAYVLPYISDNGPPPATGKSFNELLAEMPTSSTEHQAALHLKDKVSSVLDCAGQELTGGKDYWELFEELNRRLWNSNLSFAWKNNPSGPDYNPDLGVIERTIGGKVVIVSIGLSKDRFAGPCAVINIIGPR